MAEYHGFLPAAEGAGQICAFKLGEGEGGEIFTLAAAILTGLAKVAPIRLSEPALKKGYI